ncbi:pilus assembly protein Flp/PilA [Serratia fonticola]|jgi:pilus assembly protein Flp/PilA|uniref:Pilus assembly protein Flp/PilA n=1 Tax=Serratia fonticola TaxID=47917 RepID=A0A559T402_SERFO|nr:Flp family type IVb pilin [Serratia fonticola]TQI78166.1 pilus assembly protein Flp/PilA [Serratia fonticola]TQI94836.1 pilus assembly protein Flp/PilA [Serratia fonticola]TVZ69334.1 pilus assembly protein Flp/PilA [Serratia fonticola]
MFNDLIIKAYSHVAVRFADEKGITAIEYAIIGVAMSSALYFIFNEGNFLSTLQKAWSTMGTNITSSGNILGTP